MFIDYVPIILINMAAGLFVLAYFILRGLAAEDHRKWASAFAMTGTVALVSGFHMTFHWPLPGSYNVPYGELSVLFGIIFLGAAFSMSKSWNLSPVTVFAFFGGIISVLVGVRFIDLGLTPTPRITAAGFIATGAGGIFSYPLWRYRHIRPLRIVGSLVMIGAGTLWTVTSCMAYWMHLEKLSGWVPLVMQKAP